MAESKRVWWKNKKKKVRAVSVEGMSWFLPQEWNGHQGSSYIRTLLITTSILTTHPFIHSVQLSHCQWTLRGVTVMALRRSSSIVSRHLGNEWAKNTTFPLTVSHLLLHTIPLDHHTSANTVFTGSCSTIASLTFCQEHSWTDIMSPHFSSVFFFFFFCWTHRWTQCEDNPFTVNICMLL